MHGLKISRSGELTTGLNGPFWALTAKNVSLSQTVCALSLQQHMPAALRWLPYLVAGGPLWCLSGGTRRHHPAAVGILLSQGCQALLSVGCPQAVSSPMPWDSHTGYPRSAGRELDWGAPATAPLPLHTVTEHRAKCPVAPNSASTVTWSSKCLLFLWLFPRHQFSITHPRETRTRPLLDPLWARIGQSFVLDQWSTDGPTTGRGGEALGTWDTLF